IAYVGWVLELALVATRSWTTWEDSWSLYPGFITPLAGRVGAIAFAVTLWNFIAAVGLFFRGRHVWLNALLAVLAGLPTTSAFVVTEALLLREKSFMSDGGRLAELASLPGAAIVFGVAVTLPGLVGLAWL